MALEDIQDIKKGVMQVVAGMDLTVEMFDGDANAAARWFQEPNALLFGDTPFEVCIQGEGSFLIHWLARRLGRQTLTKDYHQVSDG